MITILQYEFFFFHFLIIIIVLITNFFSTISSSASKDHCFTSRHHCIRGSERGTSLWGHWTTSASNSLGGNVNRQSKIHWTALKTQLCFKLKKSKLKLFNFHEIYVNYASISWKECLQISCKNVNCASNGSSFCEAPQKLKFTD